MINLHDIVRPAITALHPDETVLYLRSVGQINVKGRIYPEYKAGTLVKAQIQAVSSNDLQHFSDVSRTKITAKAYLYAEKNQYPAGIKRNYCRSGDLLQRADGKWWLITAVMENFSSVGWVCVGITEQLQGPQDSILGFVREDGVLAPIGQGVLWAVR